MIEHKTSTSYRKNWKPNPETNSGLSETVPDQVLPIKELLRRHTQGLYVPTIQPVYDPDGEMPHPKSMDLVDVQEMQMSNAKTIADVKSNARKKAKTADPISGKDPKGEPKASTVLSGETKATNAVDE